MQFEVKGAQAELRNVNLRTENNGDERVLAIDLKIRANVHRKELLPLFDDTPDLLPAMFAKNGDVLNPYMDHSYRVQIENIELRIDKLKPFKGARIKKGMHILPRSGNRFEITFTAQIHDVVDVRTLADRLHEECKITILERQAKLPLSVVA